MASIKANARKVVCIGRNYADHIKELNNTRPKNPFFFLKPTSSILPPPHNKTPILLPRNVNVHYEVELGIVIGKPAHNLHIPSSLPDEDAMAKALPYIKSYFIGIDLTGRNLQEAAKKSGLPWTTAKGFDTFLPISNEIPRDKIPDPHNARIWLSVNGEKKQDDNTNLMLFRIPRILSEISRVMTLEEGDLVITGTPKGVGSIVTGDRVECGIEVQGSKVEEGSIEIGVEDAAGPEDGGYDFARL
ncbi:hypothetical protein LTR05_007742 [Lithohypha guttulata]|uniref:Fumarylacetoacetase-like C-terminal domain-containing protein n=1 Tax=Lithohypha guttulata TaxID=1690604 RepID=A0AAN7Y3Z9_9EURO|nr:hypothetical protein LTR05_007742 [Lithohypha guttulata]